MSWIFQTVTSTVLPRICSQKFSNSWLQKKFFFQWMSKSCNYLAFRPKHASLGEYSWITSVELKQMSRNFQTVTSTVLASNCSQNFSNSWFQKKFLRESIHRICKLVQRVRLKFCKLFIHCLRANWSWIRTWHEWLIFQW